MRNRGIFYEHTLKEEARFEFERQVNKWIEEGNEIDLLMSKRELTPKWVLERQITLISGNKINTHLQNYRPKNVYQQSTKLSHQLIIHLENNNILPEERREIYGYKEQLLVNRVIIDD